jgi:hypothetical protein
VAEAQELLVREITVEEILPTHQAVVAVAVLEEQGQALLITVVAMEVHHSHQALLELV